MINITSFDINHRILDFRGDIVDMYYVSSLCGDDKIAYLVEGITGAKGKTLKDCLNNGDVKTPNDPNKEEYALLTGNTLIKYKGTTFVLDTRSYPSRSIQEPETEKSVRGSKDGFNESLLTSVGLIRRRVRTMDLTFQAISVGATNKLDICVCYLASQVDQKLLKEVLKRVNAVKANDLVMSDRAIEEIILQQKYNPFPLVRYSERPDVVSTHIMHGYIAIICDTSSSVMMLPATLFEILEHVEEHRQTPLIGTFIRLLRFGAVALSVYLVPIWLLFFINKGSDYNYIWQVIAVELAVELLRIATIHTPTSLSNAMGVIAAVLLGQFAIDLGFFSEEILLYCALGNVCGFATPNYELSLTNKYVKIMMIFSIMALNIYGFIIFNVALILYLMSIKPFGYSYLYPLYPFNLKDFWDFIIRKPKSKKQQP
ncbi:MAG: spore germination protein [Coprobacillaceae bacterium]